MLNEFSDSTIVTTFELVVVALETDGARKLLVAVNVKSVVWFASESTRLCVVELGSAL